MQEPGKVRSEEKAGLGRGERCRGGNAGPQGEVAPRDGGAGGGGLGKRTGRGQGRGQGPPVPGTLGCPGSRRGGSADRTHGCPRGPHRQEGAGAGLSPRRGKEGPPGPEPAGSGVRAGARGGSPAAGSGARPGPGPGGGPEDGGLGKSREGRRRELTYFSKRVKCQSPYQGWKTLNSGGLVCKCLGFVFWVFFFSDAKQKIGEGRSPDSLLVADLGREWPEGSRGEELSLRGALLGERRGLKGLREVNQRVPGLSA